MTGFDRHRNYAQSAFKTQTLAAEITGPLGLALGPLGGALGRDEAACGAIRRVFAVLPPPGPRCRCTRVPYMWVFTANGKRRRGRTFVGAHASGHLKDPEAAEAFLPPANGSQVVAALASGQTRTARAIIIK